MSDARLLDELAQAFLERVRKGERPTVTEYVQKHPKLADQIRELFPTLLVMEEAAPDRADATAPPRQLGEYRILREVGRGGMGVVYDAEQVSLGRLTSQLWDREGKELAVLRGHEGLVQSAASLLRFRRGSSSSSASSAAMRLPVGCGAESPSCSPFSRVTERLPNELRCARRRDENVSRAPVPDG